MSKLFFKKEKTRSYGRNGLYNTIGVSVGVTYSDTGEYTKFDGAISLTGLTSRQLPASGSLVIPKGDIDNLIELLKKYRP